MPQRIEGQYRRHWAFVPGLWSLHFRDQVNTGANLRVSANADAVAAGGVEQDAGMAAADLYKKLESGFYLTQTGEKRRIDHDTSKLWYAIGLTNLQKKLLRDISFRTRMIPGTQEIRTMIGHLGFWATVVYGSGIFMTVSPGERHNYLAIRLSRYRANDPYITESASKAVEEPWIGAERPSLHADSEHRFQSNPCKACR